MVALRLHTQLRVIALLLAGLAGSAQAAGTGSLAVTAFVPSKSNCKFSTGAMTLNFGNINQSSGVNATGSATTTFTCNGSAPLASYSVSAGDGLYSTGPGARRMRNSSLPTEFMAYSISLSPASGSIGKGVPVTLTVAGTIQPFQFQNVAAGAYADTVVLTLAP